MINKFQKHQHLILATLLGAVITGCTTTPRTGPNAPVYERGSKVSGWIDGVLGSGQTAGIDSPEVTSGDTVYQPEAIESAPATAPTQAPEAEKIAMAETGSYQPRVVAPAPASSGDCGKARSPAGATPAWRRRL